MQKINLYFRNPPAADRLLPGDRFIIPVLRNLVYGKRISGVEKVFTNLCRSFDLLQVNYSINPPFDKIKPGEPVVVLGNGTYALQGYDKTNPVIAGIGLMTHPSEWPGLFNEYPIAIYLQHSQWAKNVYARYYGTDQCGIWPAGIDTDQWRPEPGAQKKYDLLIYNKILWNKEQTEQILKSKILDKLNELGLPYTEIKYGHYTEPEYRRLLQQSKAMLFLCEHESQGFACCEALSMNVPVLAWDQGYWLDPNRFKWNDPVIPATSVPFFDDSCGMTFADHTGFIDKIGPFLQKTRSNQFHPRDYILHHISLKKSGQIMLDIINRFYP